MRWVGHVARIGGKRNATGYCWESQTERHHWEDQDVGGWTILKWILDRMGWCGVIGLICLRKGTSGGLL
jgi:hypothetical protein